MKNFFTAVCFLLLPAFAFCQQAQSAKALDNLAKQFSASNSDAFNVLNEDDDIKTLALKYAAAAEQQKPQIKKEVRAKALAEEELAIKKTEQRLKRQEDKIKELKQKIEQRKKDKEKTADLKTEDILSAASLSKLLDAQKENPSAKPSEKVKSKAASALKGKTADAANKDKK